MMVSQINLLICLVNDILDFKLMQQDKFQKRVQTFNPTDTFKFIMDIFEHQVKV